MRPERKRYSGRFHRADVLEQFQGVLPLLFFALMGWGIDHSVREYSSEPCLLGCPGDVFHMKVHVNETCGSGSRHLHGPKKCTKIAHFPCESFLQWPDLPLQTLLEFEVVRVSAE